MGLRRYVRSHLHRRLFVWFGLTILLSTLVVGAAAWVTSRTEAEGWTQEIERVRRFAGGRFALVWEDRAAREELARRLSRDLDIEVVLRDARAVELGRFGPRCRAPRWAVPVDRGATHGSVELCWPRNRTLPLWRIVLPLLLATAVLWAASGRIARGLARPLARLTATARDLGDGKLSSRVRLGRHEPGEVGRLADALNDMAERIERQIGDQRELLAAVSHELRTPLSRIRLLVELLGTRGGDPRLLADLDREVVEIDALVGELLAASRLDFATLAVRPVEPVELAARALERAGLDAARLVAEPTPKLDADPTLLARALANLLDNARKHGGGATALRVASRGGAVVYEVDDEGPGFRDGDEARVFQPFYQGTSGAGTTRDGSSLGLGLALVRRIAEAHGGRAFARNRTDGPGATVGLELPLRRPAA